MVSRSAFRLDARADRGVSLVETVVAVVILGILATAVIGVILQAQAQTVTNRARVAAANLAAREIDLIRDEFHRSDTAPTTIAGQGTRTNPHPLAGQADGAPFVIDGGTYTVVRSVQWNVKGTGESACDGGKMVRYPTLGVTVSVTWPNMGSIPPVTNSTVLAPKKGTGVPDTASFVAVKVSNAAGQPSVGRTVKVTGGGASVSQPTGPDGCAVIQVNPASAGTSYTAQVMDVDYVDIAGTAQPSKQVGSLKPGQLNNNVIFTVDRAGSATIRLVDSEGSLVPPATASGAVVTLVASEFSGASPEKQYTMTGNTIVVSGLWPTLYGAYYGTVPPAGGYQSATLAPGGSITLDTVLELATTFVTDLPDGTTAVVAVPAGGTTCTAPGAQHVAPGAVSLLPGSWSFFAQGPTFACAPGPASVTLGSGANDGISWEPTRLSVVGAPAGTLWALDQGLAGSLTTCPSGAFTPVAVNVDAARDGWATLPAGSWYVYVGSADGTCSKIPGGQYAKSLPYAVDTTLQWPPNSAQVTITGIEGFGSSGNRQAYVYVSPTSNIAALTCTTRGVSYQGVSLSSVGQSRNGGSLSTTIGEGTFYIVGNDQTSSSPGCHLAGTVNVGPSSSALTIDYNTTSPRTVGP